MADDQKLTPEQGWKLAELIHALRPDWGTQGIHTNIGTAVQAELGNKHQTSLAAIRAAADPTNKTPAIIHMPGKHWSVEQDLTDTQAELKAAKDKLAGKYTAPDTNDPPCADHLGQHLSTCTECRKLAVPPPPNFRELAGLPPKSVRATRKPRKQLEPTTTPTEGPNEGPTP